jgi:hypothetical protein
MRYAGKAFVFLAGAVLAMAGGAALAAGAAAIPQVPENSALKDDAFLANAKSHADDYQNDVISNSDHAHDHKAPSPQGGNGSAPQKESEKTTIEQIPDDPADGSKD